MNQAAPSPADLAAELAVNGAIAMIAGNVRGKSPVEGIPLRDEERLRLGVSTPGPTMFYPAGEDGVFFDFGGEQATIWFNGGDCARGVPAFEAALRQSYPHARLLEDGVNAQDYTLGTRVYEVEFGGGKYAVVDVAFPSIEGGKQQFAVRVFAKRRPGA